MLRAQTASMSTAREEVRQRRDVDTLAVRDAFNKARDKRERSVYHSEEYVRVIDPATGARVTTTASCFIARSCICCIFLTSCSQCVCVCVYVCSCEQSEIPKIYECWICRDILDDPYVHACGEQFCSRCLVASIESCGASCPFCKASITTDYTKTLIPGWHTTRNIKAMSIVCLKPGCPVSFGLVDENHARLDKHIKDEGHHQAECPYATCTDTVWECDLAEHIKDHPVECAHANRGCTHRGTGTTITEHERTCDCRPTPCPYSEQGCRSTPNAHASMAHTSVCYHKPVTCQRCDIMVLRGDLSDHDIVYSGRHLQIGDERLRAEKAEHFKTQCSLDKATNALEDIQARMDALRRELADVNSEKSELVLSKVHTHVVKRCGSKKLDETLGCASCNNSLGTTLYVCTTTHVNCSDKRWCATCVEPKHAKQVNQAKHGTKHSRSSVPSASSSSYSYSSSSSSHSSPTSSSSSSSSICDYSDSHSPSPTPTHSSSSSSSQSSSSKFRRSVRFSDDDDERDDANHAIDLTGCDGDRESDEEADIEDNHVEEHAEEIILKRHRPRSTESQEL